MEVEFSEPFPDWPTLFSPLLPSHLMKDFPGGWGAALGADLPLSANRFKMNSYDPVTGQISLARNDKYWGTPPQPAAVVLRLGDSGGPAGRVLPRRRAGLVVRAERCDGDVPAGRRARRPAHRRAHSGVDAVDLQHAPPDPPPTSPSGAAIAAGINQSARGGGPHRRMGRRRDDGDLAGAACRREAGDGDSDGAVAGGDRRAGGSQRPGGRRLLPATGCTSPATGRCCG